MLSQQSTGKELASQLETQAENIIKEGKNLLIHALFRIKKNRFSINSIGKSSHILQDTHLK